MAHASDLDDAHVAAAGGDFSAMLGIELDQTLKGSPKGTPTGSRSGTANGPLTGSLIGSSTQKGSATRRPRNCDRSLHEDSLKAFDKDERVVDAALAVAGLETLFDMKQMWSVDGAALEVSKWAAESGDFALRVWSGMPRLARAKKAAESLDPATVYAYALSGELFVLSHAEHAKWKLRLLLDAGIIPSRVSHLPPLPPHAPATQQRVWEGIVALVAVDRACGCHAPGDAVVATPRFMARWTGTTFDRARDGIRRLRNDGYLTKVGSAALSTSDYKANRYIVRGDA